MSANAEIFSLPVAEPPAHLEPAPDLGQAAAPESLPPANPEQPRRNGKIPHLPQAQRDLINSSFDDGLTYQAVARKLAEQGVILNLKNLSDWFHGGYQDELQARERRAMLVNSQDRLLELSRKQDAPDLSFVGLQLAVTQLAQQLYDMAPGSHQESFQTDTHNYLRMLNTLARMSKAMLALQKHRDEAAKAQAPQLAEKDPDRDLNDNEYGLLVNKMDQVFKVRRRKPANGTAPSLRAPVLAPSAPELNSVRTDSTPSLTVVPAPPAPAPASPTPTPVPGLPVGPLPPAGGPASSIQNLESSITTPPPPVTRHASPSPDRCHECRSLLPPLLPSGERPSPHCNKCGTGLRAPGALIEYCPKCRHVLPELKGDGTRPTPNCQNCNKPLPPPPS